MESTLEIRRQFFPPGYAAEYRMQAPLPRHAVPVLADRALAGLVPAQALRGEELTDLKGRDPQPPPAQIPDAWLPKPEELFFAAGRVPWSDEPVSKHDEFSVRIQSHFLAFEGTHHISHTTELKRKELPALVPLRVLGLVFPLDLTALRVGLEIFESRRFLASVGFSPIVTQSFLLECYDNTLYLTVTAEGLKGKDQLPLEQREVGRTLDAITAQLCGTGWRSDYQRRARKR